MRCQVPLKYYSGAIAVGSDVLTRSTLPMVVEAVNCTGTEPALKECLQKVASNGTQCEDAAGVICQGMLRM